MRATLLCLHLAIRRRDPDFLPVYALLGAGVAFVAATYIKGSILENERYYILVIPLLSLAVGMIAPRPVASSKLTGSTFTRRWRRRLVVASGTTIAAAAIASPIPVAFVQMQSQTADLSDYGIRSVFQPDKYPPAEDAQILQTRQGSDIANYLASLQAGNSSIVMDSYLGFPILVNSLHSKEFVITSDYDFTPLMNDPNRFGIKYYMVPEPTSSGLLDAVNRRYPTMWGDGAGIATLDVEFRSTVPGVPSWRLYKAIRRWPGSTAEGPYRIDFPTVPGAVAAGGSGPAGKNRLAVLRGVRRLPRNHP